MCTVLGTAVLLAAVPGSAAPAVRARLARAADVEIAPGRTLVLLEWTDVTGPTGTWCTRFVGFGEGDGAVAKKSIGVVIDGLVVEESRDRSEPWCLVNAPAPLALRPDLRAALDALAARGDAALPALGVIHDFFAGAKRSPVHTELIAALEKLTSPAALQFALDKRLYFFAQRRPMWRTDPKLFPVVEKGVLATRGGLPDVWLMDLFWRLSPARARATIRALRSKDPARAHDLLVMSPPWDEAIDEIGEHLDRELAAGRAKGATHLATMGNERILRAMRAVLAAAPSTEFSGPLREEIADLDRRAALGVTDASSLAAYLWKHKRLDTAHKHPLQNMRITLTGKRTGSGCSIVAPGAGYEIRAAVECDAETHQRLSKLAADATITITGTFRSGQTSDTRVELEIDYATAVPPP